MYITWDKLQACPWLANEAALRVLRLWRQRRAPAILLIDARKLTHALGLRPAQRTQLSRQRLRARPVRPSQNIPLLWVCVRVCGVCACVCVCTYGLRLRQMTNSMYCFQHAR